jgi:multiple sugar transport system substrate-binding protein
MADTAQDIRSAILPVGPIGQSVELNLNSSAVIFRHTKFPNAAKAYLQFMLDKPQMDAWISASSAYFAPPLRAMIENPIWEMDPVHRPFKRASETLRPNGYAGPLGYASAAVMADYIMVDMVAEAATGQRAPEEAAKRAEQRANRYYRV